MIQVKALGKFILSDGEYLLNDDILRSDRLKKLLIYILMHREHPITTQELAEALWTEEETDNPAGALKNLMYRLRKCLKSALGNRTYILTGPGVYCWNRALPVTLDVEEFEQFAQNAKRAGDMQESIENYEKALECYRGEFMDHALDKHWMVTLSTYYHSLFLTLTKELAEIYFGAERYRDIERICMRGLQFDRADEQLHYSYIKALIHQNKFELAMRNYEEAVTLLYDSLGVRNSRKLQEVQKELLQMKRGKMAECFQNIYEDMQEEEKPTGAYLCGYPVFREIYRLEKRKIERTKKTEYILLLTAELSEGGRTYNQKMEQFFMNQAMKHLESALKETLRIGDVAARYSDCQFVILLPACTLESGRQVARRILIKFREKTRGNKITIKTDFEPIKAGKQLC